MLTQSCHFIIQINSHHIVFFADISGICEGNKRKVIQNLTYDFGSMTNEVLRLSQYYKDYEFAINETHENMTINRYLQTHMTPHSDVLLVTLIDDQKV